MSKILIEKSDCKAYYRLNPVSAGGGRKVMEMNSYLVTELLKFQETADDVQKLLKAYYEGSYMAKLNIRLAVERLNASHNRRPD